MRLARPMTAAQRERAERREAARAQREAWRFDRWAPGSTVTLGPREDRFQEDARAAGFDPALFSPATLDAARWTWLHVQLGRVTPGQFRIRVSWHAGRD